MTRFLRGLYYWLDLYGPGPDPRPAHAKVLSTLAMLILLGGFLSFGIQIVRTSATITTGLLWYALIIAVIPYGMDGIKTVAKLRWGSDDRSHPPPPDTETP